LAFTIRALNPVSNLNYIIQQIFKFQVQKPLDVVFSNTVSYVHYFQGHCHPKVMKALVEQAERLTLSSRAFFNDKFPVFAAQLTSMFGYDMVLPMNTGAEGVETAIKLARKWGYEKKKIPKNEVRMLNN
jgi:acetylornithine/succinyldiaminopimelate/putrescine aminotransferase